jgi:hypothetical protein
MSNLEKVTIMAEIDPSHQNSPEAPLLGMTHAQQEFYPYIANDNAERRPEQPWVSEPDILAAEAKEVATPGYLEEEPVGTTPEAFETLDPHEASRQMQQVAAIIEANREEVLNPGNKDDYTLVA